ncbi:MAG: ATP-dependent helicase [bacterium]|nr:ATP-dependent helicase [bacterium]
MPDLTALNEAQRRAVTWGEGPLLLLAGPGSGKTLTITNRILFLLEQGTPPERILAVTFTKEAAVSMQRRFRKMSKQLYPVNFGTFHSVFYHILQRSAGHSQLRLLTGVQKRNLMIPVLKKYTDKSDGTDPAEMSGEVDRMLSAVSFYKNTEDKTRAADKAPAAFRGAFEEICREYGASVQRAGGIDFDDMLFTCRDLLRDSQSVREYWQGCFSHILIDEFQDINPIQYEAVKLLSAVPHNIFAVGDDDQSIYGFRGSKPELMRRFEEEFQAGRLLLDINYRCGGRIVSGAAAVIGENSGRFLKALRPAPGRQENMAGEGVLRIRAFADKEEQNACLAGELGAWWEKYGKSQKSCAVLFRTNACMQRAAARLKSSKIPFVMKEKSRSIYEHFIVKDVMAYLTLAAGSGGRGELLRIINKPFRGVEREAFGESGDIRGLIRYCEREYLSGQTGRETPEQLRLLQTQLKNIGKMKPLLAVNYILKAVKYEDYLRAKARTDAELWEEWQEILEWLKEDAALQKNAADWLEMQKSYTEQLERQPRPSAGDESFGIRLMTAHGSKGLEFDRVYIPDCNERMFPHGSMPDLSCVEEERRLFYVAMTRAKETLELMYLTGDRLRPRVPSRFLNPLLYSSSMSTSSSNSQLSRYSSNASETFSYSSSSEM